MHAFLDLIIALINLCVMKITSILTNNNLLTVSETEQSNSTVGQLQSSSRMKRDLENIEEVIITSTNSNQTLSRKLSFDNSMHQMQSSSTQKQVIRPPAARNRIILNKYSTTRQTDLRSSSN